MKKKIYLKRFQSYYGTYLDILTAYRSNNGWFLDSEEDRVHTVPFLLTTASALECTLNDHIIEHYSDSYEEKHAKLLIPGLLSMTLKGKLQNIVPLLTSNKYIINTNHKIYQILVDLIKLRNNLVHNKSEFDVHEAYVREDEQGNPYIEPDDELKRILDTQRSGEVNYSLGIDRNIADYHDALEELHELFFTIYKEPEFTGNELIIELKQSEVDKINITL